MKILKIFIFIVIFLIVITLHNAYTDTIQSPKRIASGDFAEDIYDIYDYITERPDMLGRMHNVHFILYPSQLLNDTQSLINEIINMPERNINNAIGFGVGTGNFGFGVYFEQNFQKLYSENPIDQVKESITDYDQDGITTESNEFKIISKKEVKKFNGAEDYHFGGGFGFSAGGFAMGLGYQGYINNSALGNNSFNSNSSFRSYFSSDDIDMYSSSLREQLFKKGYQHNILINIGIDKTERIFTKDKQLININKPLFVLETKFMIILDREILRNRYKEEENDDPEGKISSRFFNKKIHAGTVNNPVKEEDNTYKGNILHLKPKITIASGSFLKYNLQGKYGLGIDLKKSTQSKTVYHVEDYRTDFDALYQDTYTNHTELSSIYRGSIDHLMYGFRIEQVYKPKYFIMGIALDITIEQNISKLNGYSTRSETTKYSTTSTNYKLQSPFYTWEDARSEKLEYSNYSTGTIHEKQLNSIIKIPVGFQFELSKHITLRSGYIYQVQNITSKVVYDTTFDHTREKTVNYADPSFSDKLAYETGQQYIEDGGVIAKDIVITSEKIISNIISSGFAIILSKNTTLNIGARYNINYDEGLILIDTHFRI